MAKTHLDIKAGMPSEDEVEDRGTLGNAKTIIGATSFTNVKKDQVRCGNYERHHQILRAYQLAGLGNMFSNFVKSTSTVLATVRSMGNIQQFVTSMLERYGVAWFWDPEYDDPLAGRKCNLLMSLRDQMIRLVLDLAYDACEKENDALGLRGLRRVSIPYFRNKSKAATSKYGRYLICDLVHELSASERSRFRMDMYVTTNPSGTRGGGMAR